MDWCSKILKTRNSCNFFHVWIASRNSQEFRRCFWTKTRNVASLSHNHAVWRPPALHGGWHNNVAWPWAPKWASKLEVWCLPWKGWDSGFHICSIQIHFSESSSLKVSCLLLQMDSFQISKIEGFMTMELKTVSHQPRRCHHFCRIFVQDVAKLAVLVEQSWPLPPQPLLWFNVYRLGWLYRLGWYLEDNSIL